MHTKKTIYLIRHGETEYNKLGIIQGSGVNSDLNQHGHQQAEKLYKAYHHVPFDKIYSSELNRTVQSVEPFRRSGVPFEALSYFNEISWGVLEGLVSTPQSHRLYINMLEDWKAGLLDLSVQGGESPSALSKRLSKGLDYLHRQKDENTLLICMHGRSMRVFLCLLTGTPLSQMDEFKHSNLCLYILEKNDKNYQVVEPNSVAHLWI
jgi:probable phosphoglycerate mutase